MIFDLKDWLPHQTIGMSLEAQFVVLLVLGAGLACVVLCSRQLWCQYHSTSTQQQSEVWHKVMLWVAIVVSIFGTVVWAVTEIPLMNAVTVKTTSVSQYITEQAEAYTPVLTDVECETPVVDNKYEFLEQDGRYSCTWRFDGKPVKGSVSIADSKAIGWFSSTPPTATLVDSHGGVWCPVEWKTPNGCEPVFKPPEAS